MDGLKPFTRHIYQISKLHRYGQGWWRENRFEAKDSSKSLFCVFGVAPNFLNCQVPSSFHWRAKPPFAHSSKGVLCSLDNRRLTKRTFVTTACDRSAFHSRMHGWTLVKFWCRMFWIWLMLLFCHEVRGTSTYFMDNNIMSEGRNQIIYLPKKYDLLWIKGDATTSLLKDPSNEHEFSLRDYYYKIFKPISSQTSIPLNSKGIFSVQSWDQSFHLSKSKAVPSRKSWTSSSTQKCILFS